MTPYFRILAKSLITVNIDINMHVDIDMNMAANVYVDIDVELYVVVDNNSHVWLKKILLAQNQINVCQAGQWIFYVQCNAIPRWEILLSNLDMNW